MAKKEKVERLTSSVLSERIEVLKKMFPEFFTEGKIDVPKLKELVGEEIEEETERYSFTWAGKRDAIQLLQTPTRATLVPSHEESIDFDATGNIFIEGDNLEVLKLLYKSYFGQVKMIYIDPPYNTGGDFVYSDNYVDPLQSYLQLTGQKDENGNSTTNKVDKSGRYHSGWLSMMYPRLFLARQLLRDEGIIFISIDDHEVHNLRMLMNEVFGEENMLQQLVWQRHAGGGNDAKHFATDHEYILAYAKNLDAVGRLRRPLTEEEKTRYNERDDHFATRGPYRTSTFLRMRPDDPSPSLCYEIECPDGTKVFNEWKQKESGFLQAKSDDRIVFKKTKTGEWRVGYKLYLNESARVPRSLLTKVEQNSRGREQLRELFDNDGIFTNPKPIGLVKHLLQFSTDHDSIVLDFFAGSGTTAHAIVELNEEDGGNRKFIMIQLPEPTSEKSKARSTGYETISDIGKDRIQRALTIRRENNLVVGSADLGVKVFKLTGSNYQLWKGIEGDVPASYAEQIRFFIENPLIEDWIPENVVYEIALKEGYRLDSHIEQLQNLTQNTIFRVVSPDQKNAFYICLDEALFQDDINALGLINDDLFVCLDEALNDTQASNLALQCRLKTI